MKVLIAAVFLFTSLQTRAKQTVLNDSTQLVVQQIAANNKFESEYVGFAGSPSQQFALMKTLENVASDHELLLLTRNRSAAVRIYAFIALCRKNSALAGKAYQVLSKDGATITTLSGCIGGQGHVASIVKQYYKTKE